MKIGKSIKVDEATGLSFRGHFARLCVEVEPASFKVPIETKNPKESTWCALGVVCLAT